MRERAALAVLFSLLLVIMVAHELEHVVQLLQQDALGSSCPNDCRGLLGFALDLEWVHFAYNTSILATLGLLVLAFRLWRSPWLVAALSVQGYHVVEHVAKLEQWLGNGHHSPTPGLLGRTFNLVELHFAINTVVLILAVAGYFALGLHRSLWQLRSKRRLAAAAMLGVVLVTATAAGWSQRPPTVRLAAGVHQGPIVLDAPQRLVGEPGAEVRGGIVVTADDVVVRDLTVVGGENGIEVDGAERVLLERVRVAGAELDGIHVRRGHVTIRDCIVQSSGPYRQGIDISFSFDLQPSVVEGCTVVGGQEGIVTHSARVRISENRVRDTTLRGITITEMSAGTAEHNDVRNGLGVGIYCGDYSHCMIAENRVANTEPDLASSNGTRMGYAILAVFGAEAMLRDNELSENHRRTLAFANARIIK